MNRLLLALDFAGTQFLDDGSSWVFALPIGQPVFDGKKMRQFSAEQVASLIMQTNAAIASFDEIAKLSNAQPYRFSVLRDHDMRGTSFGTIEEAKLANMNGKSGAWLRVSWTPEARADIQAGRIRHVSIGMDEYTNQLGQKFAPVAIELSLTSYPRIQSLGSIQETLGVRLSALALALPGDSMDPQAIAEIVSQVLAPLIDGLTQRLGALEAAVADLLPPAPAAPADAPPADTPANAPAMSNPVGPTPDAPSPEALAASQLAASQLEAFKAALDEKIAPLQEKIEKFEKLNLSKISTPTAKFAEPKSSPEDVLRNNQLDPTRKIQAYYQTKVD